MILMLILTIVAQAATVLPKRDYSKMSKWEEQEVDQAKKLLEKNLPAPVCGDSEWAVGLRRIQWAVMEAMPDKRFQLSEVMITPPGKSPNDVTMCGVISVVSADKCDAKKADEKKSAEAQSSDKPDDAKSSEAPEKKDPPSVEKTQP